MRAAPVTVRGAVGAGPAARGARGRRLPNCNYDPRVVRAESQQDEQRWRHVEAATGASLSRLDVADIFDEVLDRVRELLQVDTAAILLLDVRARHLVATAARGLEEEVRQGFRVSIGRGFAGKVALTQRPVIIEDVRRGKVVNPVLLQTGVRSLLGVPIFSGGAVVGVLHVGSLVPRRFSPDDVRLLELVATHVGLAGRVRQNTLDHSAALALQRSLIPAELPDLPSLQLAGRYVPGHASGVGGDWYDVFTLPSGWMGVVMGDVSGHGLQSAVVMGRVRSALRAYALVCDDPAEALTLLDRKVVHFEAGSLTTALYAMIPPDGATIHLSLAGHPAPVLAAPGRRTATVEAHIDPPLGTAQTGLRRHTTAVDFPPGGVLVAYTDGLVERRDEFFDAGVARLAAAVPLAPPETVCDTVMATLDAENPADDVALLAIRRIGD